MREALRARPPGRYALQAAIAAVHAEAPSWDATDWAEIVGLYDVLVEMWPSPVVALNRAVAVGFARGPQAGLAALDDLAAEPQLASYPYLAAARADFLRRLGHAKQARTAYDEALLLSDNDVERATWPRGSPSSGERRAGGSAERVDAGERPSRAPACAPRACPRRCRRSPGSPRAAAPGTRW